MLSKALCVTSSQCLSNQEVGIYSWQEYLNTLNPDILPAMNTSSIVAELKAEIKKMEQAITVLESVGGSSRSPRTKSGSARTAARGKISAAGRRRIALAQKARWAKVRSEAAKASRK
jgi:hypothetical protein